MAGRRGRERRWRLTLASELDLLPLMNIFIVIIPLLLLSAVFVEVTVIRMDSTSGEAAAAEDESGLDLAVRITDGAYIVEGRDLAAVTIARPPAAGAEAADEAALGELSAALARIVEAHPGDPNVRIVADPTTHYDEIVAVMDVARAAGLPQAGLAGAASGGI